MLKRSLITASLAAFSVLILFTVWLQTESASGLRTNLKQWFTRELITVDQLPPETTVDAIYVLGGSQNSLELKFKRASELYHQGICKKILILHRPGITEYSRLLKRNLTNDEWAILRLEELGIPKEYVEPISIKKEFFGTFAEAKGVSRLTKKRSYKNMVLISTPYHTRRVKISFENFLRNQELTLYVQGSDNGVFLRHLLVEFIKLKIYEYFLLSSDDHKMLTYKSLVGYHQ